MLRIPGFQNWGGFTKPLDRYGLGTHGSGFGGFGVRSLKTCCSVTVPSVVQLANQTTSSKTYQNLGLISIGNVLRTAPIDPMFEQPLILGP